MIPGLQLGEVRAEVDDELREWIETHWPLADEEPPQPTVTQQLTSIEQMALAPEMEFLYLLCCGCFMIRQGATVPEEILERAVVVVQRAAAAPV